MAVKKEKQPGKGTREQNSQGRDPRTREQNSQGKGPENPLNKEEQSQPQVKFYNATRGSTTRGEERNTVLQVRKQRQVGQQVLTTNESNVIINTDQKGSCLSSEAENFRGRG